VSLIQRPGPRFVVEALAIVVTAVIGGVLHLAWWAIALLVLVVFLIAVGVESWLGRPAPEPVVQRPAPPVEEAPHVRVMREPEERAPEPEPQPEAEAPAPEPEPAPPPVPPVPTAPRGGPWNVWELERALRDSGEQDEEKTFLLHYLREYAGADGTLPPEFDDLVRESFGSVLGAAT